MADYKVGKQSAKYIDCIAKLNEFEDSVLEALSMGYNDEERSAILDNGFNEAIGKVEDELSRLLYTCISLHLSDMDNLAQKERVV